MAEMLVRIVDKINPDPKLDLLCRKRGDVVCIMPDGHGWSEAEITNPEWTIVKFPGVSRDKLDHFIHVDRNQDGKLIRRCANSFDIDTHEQRAQARTLAAPLQPGEEAIGVSLASEWGESDIQTMTIVKPALEQKS